MKKNQLLFAFLILLTLSTHAQVILENNPTGLKWYQVNTEHFRVLFTKGFEQQAQRMANTLEHLRVPEAKSMESAPRKISVILQNQSAISNGFVSITPRRSEFYTMPSQNYNFLGTNDWLNMLASHEYRHIAQYQHATRGFNKMVYYLFGPNTLAAMAHVAAPQWFWEGDAVATETAFTHSGRGRIPNFDLLFKTNLMEGRTFNYHKQYLRSYKHNIPNHYVLGFHMVSYLRKKTNDPDIWAKITARSWNLPFIPFAFSNAIKKETGLYVTDLYKSMAGDLKKEWQKEIDNLQLTPFEKVPTNRRKGYTDYTFPQMLDDGSIVAMKEGIGNIEQFVILKNGKECKAFTPGFINEAGMLSIADSKIVWNEFGYDPRWIKRNYTLIKTYDFKTKKKRRIGSRHERLAGAALSPDGKQVLTVRTDAYYKTTLVAIDFTSGKVVKEFANPENHFISMARWSDDGKKIVALKTTSLGRTVSLIDFDSGISKDLLPESHENIGYPILAGGYLLYNSPVTGIDNIFALDLNTHIKYQITSSKYGAYNPVISKDGKTMYYNEQGRDGMDVVYVSFDPVSWKKFEPNIDPTKSIADILTAQEGMPNLLDSIPQKQLKVTRYSKLKGLINPYGWGVFLDNSLTQVSVGISSQDILSTTQINTGYYFDVNERTGSWKASVSYQALFPIIDVQATHSNRKVNEGDIAYLDVDSSTVIQNLTFDWKETTLEAGLRIPLNLTASKFVTNMIISNYVGYTAVKDFHNSINGEGRLLPRTKNSIYFFRDYIDGGSFLYNHLDFSFHRRLKTSRRDINSKWAQSLFINHYSTPYGGDYSGNQFSLYGVGYFPGLFKHHSLWGYWAYQKSDIPTANQITGEGLNNYTFRNHIPLPRGQSISLFPEFYAMSANYALPIWYPDVALGPLLNFQRLRLNTFVDYGFGLIKTNRGNRSFSYTTVGAEVKLDLNLMRFLPQFDIGFRYSYGVAPSVSKFELLIGTFNF